MSTTTGDRTDLLKKSNYYIKGKSNFNEIQCHVLIIVSNTLFISCNLSIFKRTIFS